MVSASRCCNDVWPSAHSSRLSFTSCSVIAAGGLFSSEPHSTWSQVTLWSWTCESSTEEGPVDPAGVDPPGGLNKPVEPTGVEPTGVDPTGVEPTGVEPTGVEPTGVDPAVVEPTGVEPTGVEPTGAEFVDPAKNETQTGGIVEIGTWSIPAPAVDG